MSEQLNLFLATNCDYEENKKEQEEELHSNLTPREWATYRLIKHNSLVEHRKTTQREIYEKVSGYEWNSDEKAHDHCSQIWTDIKNNNESLEHEKIIISKNFEYWIGSEKETREYLKTLWKALAPRLKRYWLFTKKVGMDGLGKLIDKNGNPTDEKTRQFYECFNAYDIEMSREDEK